MYTNIYIYIKVINYYYYNIIVSHYYVPICGSVGHKMIFLQCSIPFTPINNAFLKLTALGIFKYLILIIQANS